MPGILDGAPVPNWVKLLVVGGVCGTIWATQQSAVTQLQRGQIETTAAINELRVDIRERLITRSEFELLAQKVEANARRLERLDSGRYR